jgi:hypothetical protein
LSRKLEEFGQSAVVKSLMHVNRDA